jgi:hypothetical protein
MKLSLWICAAVPWAMVANAARIAAEEPSGVGFNVALFMLLGLQIVALAAAMRAKP